MEECIIPELQANFPGTSLSIYTKEAFLGNNMRFGDVCKTVSEALVTRLDINFLKFLAFWVFTAHIVFIWVYNTCRLQFQLLVVNLGDVDKFAHAVLVNLILAQCFDLLC